jgi:hypothetical protein
MISLYNLLYTFFERCEKIQTKKQLEEILLIKDFNIVFEDMIDDLIGESDLNKNLKDLKNQADGKQVDHIYKYKSLILDDNIYYVGDSKYYKSSNTIGIHSQAKQFTYAKNVIQRNIKLFNEGNLENNLRYRENITEGYNITPNFFISAFVNEHFDFKNHYLNDTGRTITQSHYKNRLFDRDTLFVQTYNINFLFVLSAYISQNSTLKSNFRKDTHKHFRDRLINYLNSNYDFYIINPINSSNPDYFISKHFKLINGKVYKPSQFQEKIIIAFENGMEDEKETILNIIKGDLLTIEEYIIK